MNRQNFQDLSRRWVVDAQALIDTERYEAAYYLAGYAVECALKACLASRTAQYDFPPKPNEVGKFYSHDLESLFVSTALYNSFKSDWATHPKLKDNWEVVRDWKVEDARYESTATKATAITLLDALTVKSDGVLQWIEKYW